MMSLLNTTIKIKCSKSFVSDSLARAMGPAGGTTALVISSHQLPCTLPRYGRSGVDSQADRGTGYSWPSYGTL